MTEVGISIAAASIATLRPLFRNLQIPGFSNTGSQSNKHGAGGADGYHRSYDLSYIHLTDTVTKSSITHTRRLSENNIKSLFWDMTVFRKEQMWASRMKHLYRYHDRSDSAVERVVTQKVLFIGSKSCHDNISRSLNGRDRWAS